MISSYNAAKRHVFSMKFMVLLWWCFWSTLLTAVWLT